MSILLDKNNRVMVMGITGAMGTFFAEDSGAYGTQIVSGVSPGRAGLKVGKIPVFNNVKQACRETGADTAMIFVPPQLVMGAALEAIESGCRLIVATADEIPVRDTITIRQSAKRNGVNFVGPNSPGIISPGKAKLGFMPSFCFKEGRVGVISRSGSLSYEGSKRLTQAGIGQSSVIGIGGDPIKGTTADEAIQLFHDDPETDVILYLGEIGGNEEVNITNYALSKNSKPVIAYIVGRMAPPGKKMGHAAALISSNAESYQAKMELLSKSNVMFAKEISEIVGYVKQALNSKN